MTMAWCFEDEKNDYADSVLDRMQDAKAIVPTLWSLEVANVLLMAQKHKRIAQVHYANFIDALSALPIQIDESTAAKAMHSIFVLAASLDLTIYDATYLELSVKEKLPLMTLDKDLIKAAKS